MNYPKVTQEDVKNFILNETYTVLPDGRTTICQLTLKNNFTVEGQSACVSIENFDAVLGNQYARERAEQKVWELLGFDLSTKVSLLNGAGEARGDILRIGQPKLYVGTKVVRALPYTLKQYNDLRGWDVPDEQDPETKGYLLEYVDGGPPNVHGFTGYLSWVPEDVFKRSYTIGIEAKSETYADRLKAEYSQLSERVKKLSSFLGTQGFQDLSRDERNDLETQFELMTDYLLVLVRRLNRI